jgi:hypothetical protein
MSQTTSEKTLASPPADTAGEGGNQPPAAAGPKRGKRLAIAAIVIAVLLIGVFVALFLTRPVNAVTVLEVSGTVEVERPPDTLTARKGMRLQNRDTVQTGEGSSSWLALDSDKAVELAELTAVNIAKQERGFVLTLAHGEIKTRIDQPLANDEDFAVHAGELVLAVRGTDFMVNYTDNTVKVAVESGAVAVLDRQGNEITVLGAGESHEFPEYITIKGVEYYTSSWWLILSEFELTDADIEPLKYMVNLTSLSLYRNQISDISPLAGLTNLTLLHLAFNPISDISPLAGLTNLTELHLIYNQISDISPLAGLTNLTFLDLEYNQISDISPLAGLTNLTGLWLRDNQISDISPLAGLTNLRHLTLSNNYQISEAQIEELRAALPNCLID